MRGHATLAGTAHAIALLGMSQNDRGPSLGSSSRRIGGINFDQVVAAAPQAVDLLVAHAFDQTRQLRVLPKEMVAVVLAVFGGESLHLAIDGIRQCAQKGAAVIEREHTA